MRENEGRSTVSAFLNDVLVPGLTGGAVASLFAVAFVVVYRTTGVLNFAHGQVVMLMPLVVLVCTDLWGFPLAAGFTAGFLALVAVVLVEERVAIRPFVQSGHALPWILSTLGFSVVMVELMGIPYRSQPVHFPWGISAKAREFAGIRFTWAEVALILAAVLVVLIVTFFDRMTTAGKRLLAVSQDVEGAAAIGISPATASRLSALIAGLIAGLTGLLLVSTQLVSPELGLSFLFNGFVAAAIGGLDNVPGVLAGGAIVGVAGQVAATYVGGAYVQLGLFAILLVVYLVWPKGIFGQQNVRAV